MKRLLPFLVAALPAITQAQVDTFHAYFKDLQGKPLPNVSILPYEGSPVLFTGDDQGHVVIPKYPAKTYEYRLTTKQSEPLNGLDVQDLVLLEALINGSWKTAHPLHELAADLDQSQSVTAEDLKLLTSTVRNGAALDFLSGVYGWRFLPANTPLSTTNPFNNLPKAKDLTAMSGVVHLNMLGYKVGDLNGDARPEKLQTVSEGARGTELIMRSKDQVVQAGTTATFTLAITDPGQWYGGSLVLKTLDGLQMVAVTSTDPQLLATQETQISSTGDRGVYLGYQSKLASIPAGKVLLSVTVKAQATTRLSEAVALEADQSYWLGGTLPRFEKQRISLEWEALPTSSKELAALPVSLHYQPGGAALVRFPALEGPGTLSVVMANGQVAFTSSLAPGASEKALELDALAPGLYWIQLSQGRQQGSIALVKP